jgi:hypothetical protein
VVSILPTPRSPWESISDSIGAGLSQTLPQAAQQRSNRNSLQESLASIKNISSNPNSTNLDIMLSALQAGAGIPGSERYMAQILPELLKQAEVNRTPNAAFAGEQNQQPQMRNREPGEPMQQRQPLPERGFGENRFFPTNKGPEGGPGHIPQEATTGKKIPLTPPSEKPAAIKKLIADNKAVGIFKTIPEATAEFDAHQEDIRSHNKAVDEELKQQVIAQKNYGQKAVDELKKVYPEATPEIESVFKKFGEEEAQKGKSEAEIDRSLAVKAKNFSDQIATIKKDASAPRLFNSIGRAANGTYKDLESSIEDLRVKLKPILDMGLYDTARNLVSGLDYYPEEVDMTVNPLGEREKTVLNKVPKIKMGNSKNPSYLNPEPIRDQESVKSAIRDLKQANPNFSLVLGRKALEDKGYDWRMYRDALNELEREGLEFTDDQRKQIGKLDGPPLSGLQTILESVKIIGR